MFDVGFWEVALICLLALIIIGPKRLPEVASKFGQWVAKFRKMQGALHQMYNLYTDYPNAGKHLIGIDSKSKQVNDLKAIQNEMQAGLDELKNQVSEVLDDEMIDQNPNPKRPTIKKSRKS